MKSSSSTLTATTNNDVNKRSYHRMTLRNQQKGIIAVPWYTPPEKNTTEKKKNSWIISESIKVDSDMMVLNPPQYDDKEDDWKIKLLVNFMIGLWMFVFILVIFISIIDKEDFSIYTKQMYNK